MTDHTDHSDAEPTGETYEPPLAVRLSDVATSVGVCQAVGDTPLGEGDCGPTGPSAASCATGEGTCCTDGSIFHGFFRHYSPRLHVPGGT